MELKTFVMIRQIEEGDTKGGGIIIPNDKFKVVAVFQRRGRINPFVMGVI